MSADPHGVALVLAGGIALGAFEAGAYEGLHDAGLSASLRWLSASSIGSVTACIIAGNPRDRRVGRLRQFWHGLASDPAPSLSFWFGALPDGPLRQAANQASALAEPPSGPCRLVPAPARLRCPRRRFRRAGIV